MTKITHKRVKFDWGDKAEVVFQLIKQKSCSAPILTLLEGSKDFIVYCDASIKGLGVVLMQREKHQGCTIESTFTIKSVITPVLWARVSAKSTPPVQNVFSSRQSMKIIQIKQKDSAISVIDKGVTARFKDNPRNFKMEIELCLRILPWKGVYNMFHVSNLKKCYADEPLAIPLDGLQALFCQGAGRNHRSRSQTVYEYQSHVPLGLSRFFDGTPGEVLSSHGNVKTNSGRSIHTSSQRPQPSSSAASISLEDKANLTGEDKTLPCF
ncbi:putative reverse transcriptase domain-containing protein [Tanacetum coccineum]|uniref:Reverse transcriptase domain-containing protein n=1 Tax=Tanacetum coccineum TaxID=301880 RepID=A0ABQ5GDI3_9ASTR